jgi:outer membrane protein OmpA-like peptidoglycan-associated protein
MGEALGYSYICRIILEYRMRAIFCAGLIVASVAICTGQTFSVGDRFEVPVVFFMPRSAAMKSDTDLSKIVRLLQQYPNTKLGLYGHCSSASDSLYSIQLSLSRANAVKSWLVAHGVSPDKLQCVGYGSSRPVASNKTSKGKGLNDRVEIIVVAK